MTAFDPAETDIEFAQYRGGTVHVIVPLREDDNLMGGTGVRMPFVEWFRIRTLCGMVLPRSGATVKRKFTDDLICIRYYRSMGEHSDRVFQHDQ